jgi:hypothetical protein
MLIEELIQYGDEFFRVVEAVVEGLRVIDTVVEPTFCPHGDGRIEAVPEVLGVAVVDCPGWLGRVGG